MSDGTVYDIAHDGVVDYDYDEDGTSDLYGYTQTGPIKNVLKFVSDIKTIDFPDLVFYDDYDEFDEAESKNDESDVAIWLMYPNDRQQAEQKAIDNLIEQVISAWSADTQSRCRTSRQGEHPVRPCPRCL